MPTKGMKIYLAGPMRGHELYNFPMFDQSRDQLISFGYDVISPADIDRKFGFDPAVSMTENFPDRKDCIKRDIAAICECEAVFLLPGWQTSEGAMIEKAAAQFLHLDLFLYNPDYPGRILDFPYIKRTCPTPSKQFA